MKYHIIVDDRFKIGQYLLGIAKAVLPINKSVKIVSENEISGLAVSPTHKKPYNQATQKALKDRKVHRAGSAKELFGSI